MFFINHLRNYKNSYAKSIHFFIFKFSLKFLHKYKVQPKIDEAMPTLFGEVKITNVIRNQNK